MLPAHHPAFLGVTATYLPLSAAATYVTFVRATELTFRRLEAFMTLGDVLLEAELGRALAWTLAKCCEPGGLWCAYLDPSSGEVSALPRTLLWSASANEQGEGDKEWWELSGLGKTVARSLGRPTCEPAFDLVVRKTELDAHLSDELPLMLAWLAEHLDEVTNRLRSTDRGTGPRPGTDLLTTMLEQQLPQVLVMRELLAQKAKAETDVRACGDDAPRAKVKAEKVSVREALEPFLEVVRRRLLKGGYDRRRPDRANASLVPVIAADLAALVVGSGGPPCFAARTAESILSSVKKRLHEAIGADPDAWPGVGSGS